MAEDASASGPPDAGWHVPTFMFGVALQVCAGMAGTAGKQLIGLSARQAAPLRARILFTVGMFMTTVMGALLNSAAYAFAAQAVIAPLSGLDVSFNILLAPYIVGEVVTPTHILGTLLVAGGGASTALFGPHDSAPLDLPGMQMRLFRWPVAVYCAGFVCAMALCFWTLNGTSKEVGSKARGLALGISAGSIAGNMFFVRCVVCLIRVGCGGDWSPWREDWLPYALVVMAVATAVGNAALMAVALREYEAVFMVTLFEGCQVAVACLSGDVVLLEMDGQSREQRVAYWASVAVVFCGLAVIGTTAGSIIGDSSAREASECFLEDASQQWLELGEVEGALRPPSPAKKAPPEITTSFLALEATGPPSPQKTASKTTPAPAVIWAGAISGVVTMDSPSHAAAAMFRRTRSLDEELLEDEVGRRTNEHGAEPPPRSRCISEPNIRFLPAAAPGTLESAR